MKRLGLGGQILVALALGALAGAVLGERATVLQPAGDLSQVLRQLLERGAVTQLSAHEATTFTKLQERLFGHGLSFGA